MDVLTQITRTVQRILWMRQEDVAIGVASGLLAYLVRCEILNTPLQAAGPFICAVTGLMLLLSRLRKLSQSYIRSHVRFLKALGDEGPLSREKVTDLIDASVEAWNARKLDLPTPPANPDEPDGGIA